MKVARRAFALNCFGIALAANACGQQPSGLELPLTPPEGTPGRGANLGRVSGIAVGSSRSIFLSLCDYHMIVRLDAESGLLKRIAGTGERGFAGDGGEAIRARLFGPTGVALDVDGNLYVADHINHRVRKVATNGIITTLAGTDNRAHTGDNGPAAQAALSYPEDVAVDRLGNVFIAELNFGRLPGRIRKVDREGAIVTVAGGGSAVCELCRATEIALSKPYGIAVDDRRSLFIADTDNRRVLKVDADGTVRTIIGGRYSDDNAAASRPQLKYPESVAVDSSGNLYIADAERIRKLTPDGVSTTVAGGGTRPPSEGPADVAALSSSGMRVALDPAGNLYITVVDRVYALKPPGVLSLLAGKHIVRRDRRAL